MIVEISSFSNPRIKYIKSLSKSRERKKEGFFAMEGRPELDYAFKSGLNAKTIAFCEHYISEHELGSLTDLSKVELLNLSKPVFDDLTYQNVPGNFLAVFSCWSSSLNEFDSNELTIVLESVEKPGNLGAVIRTCDALGIKQVIIANAEIDLFNPNVLRNSRGGIFNVKTAFVSNEEAASWINTHERSVFAAVLSDHSISYKTVDPSKVGVLLFGAEATGLSKFWLSKNDIQHIIIPMKGLVDSLNLSVSVSMLGAHFT